LRRYSPGRRGHIRPLTQFLYDSSAERGPSLFFWCVSRWGWLNYQFSPMLRRMAPPVVLKTAQSIPGIFALIDLRCSAFDGIPFIRK
ncbi:MAG: hypothetical protein M3Z08_23190, partial [Chloroflexota bacterium]|nr:hypothetical protein [Chloroflexota bacterium]